MLDILRNNTQSVVVYILFAIIILVFVFTFNTITPDQACGGSPTGVTIDELVEVGDVAIDTTMLNMALTITQDPASPGANDIQAQQKNFQYRNSRFRLLGAYGFILQSAWFDFGIEPAKVSPIHAEKTMGDLIETFLVVAEGERLGLSVSDAEMTQRIIGRYWFDDETKEFDAKRYEQMVRFQLGVSPTRFEGFIKAELIREKVITLLVGGMSLSEAEIAYQHRVDNEKVDLAVVVVDEAAAAALVKVDEGALTKWITANQDAVSKYYEDNKGDYNKEERVMVRGIQFKAPNRLVVEGEKDETKRAALVKERADKQAKADTTLALLKAKISDAGAFDATAEADTVDAAAADAAKGVITVDDFVELAVANSDNSNKDTGALFDDERDRTRMGQWPFGKETVDATFALAPGQITDVIEVDSGFWILRLEKKLAAESRSLDDVRLEIATQLYRTERAGDERKAIADEVLAAARKNDGDLEGAVDAVNEARGAADNAGLFVGSTGPFARVQAGAYGPAAEVGLVPNPVGKLPALAGAAFGSEGEVLLDQVFATEDDAKLVIAKVSAREEAGELDAETRTKLREAMLRNKQRVFYRGWYDALLAAAVEDGVVDAGSAWEDYLTQARQTFVEAGGKLASATPVNAKGEPETR